MNLECLDTIITDNLAIHIDLTDLNSWNLNTGLTSISLTKWNGAISDNINLIDFGLTGFDNGMTNIMWSGITLTPKDVLFTMHRIGYNTVTNPTSGNTSGITATTRYDLYPITAITTGNSGNYFELNGGYLQGFFKLKDYNYELFPARYNNGITIETLINLRIDSHGIFYMMGLRSEDKYNPYFSGETTTGGTTGDISTITGITTSENNYLNAFYEVEVNKKAFSDWNSRTKKEYKEYPPIDNIKNNVIAFSLTQDRRLSYKYIDGNGFIVENTSPTTITATGWTMIAIAFTPNSKIADAKLIDCAPQRTGKLIFYINGRAVWLIKEFPEYYFKAIKNQREKQIGVPYSISWGGGSFGLRHSWHYDYQKYSLYTGQNTEYINENMWVQNNPLPEDCEPSSSDDYLPGLSLTADSSTFMIKDNCDPDIEYPLTVMRVEYTGMTGTSAMTYFIKFNHPISVLSNREYTVDLSFYNAGFFKNYNENNHLVSNKVSLIVYGTIDVDIIDEVEYSNPLTSSDLLGISDSNLHPFPDRNEFQYVRDGVMYYGATGMPVTESNIYSFSTGSWYNNNLILGNIVTGENNWKPLKLVFKTKENSGRQYVYIGLLLKSTNTFNQNIPIYLNNFTYTGADILVQDNRKNDLLIEQNFNSSFIGGIQKLRIYDTALTSPEILHNAYIESKSNPYLNMEVSKGGRIIYR